MKETIGVIGDLHGNESWKKFINEKKVNKWIFLADYVDSFTIKSEKIYSNLLDIIEFKKKNMDKVILLLGNHDIQYRYLSDPVVPVCSGFRVEMAHNLHFLFKENKDLFQIAYQKGNHLFTHAGISEAWYKKHKKTITTLWENIADNYDKTGATFSDVINALDETRHRKILYEVGEARGGSRGSVGGPFWSCYTETKLGIIPNFIQYVGHTNRPDFETITIDKKTSITYCDILMSKEEFLTLEI